jgi:hypothetical protein
LSSVDARVDAATPHISSHVNKIIAVQGPISRRW